MRRGAIGILATAFLIVMPLITATAASASPNAIQAENAKPGTAAWDLPGGTALNIPTPTTAIQGYTSEISVQPRDVLHMHVSATPAAAYQIQVYRLGWYQGRGGRLIACLPSCAISELGITQPVPSPDPRTGIVDAGWPVTDAVQVAPDWVSGYFVAKLILTSGPARGQASWIPFIVRAAPGTSSAMLVQASVNTWEAYNNWGGKSLYTFNSGGSIVPASKTVAAAMVSFNRPFNNAIDVFHWEYNRVRFLERNGYDVSYQTDVDTDLNPGSLLRHRLDVVSGHDEYWSPAMRNAYEAARAAGVNLAFLGGNIGYWQARYANSDRTLVEYRKAALDPDPNPAQKTVQFGQPPVNRPECQLLGVGYAGAVNPKDPPRSYVVPAAAAADAWFAGTGLSAGAVLFDTVGYEWDKVQPGCPVPPLHVLLHFSGSRGVAGSPAPADAVMYTAPSGAHVLSDGSLQLAWALDDFGHSPHANLGAQRLFQNIFASLLPPPGSLGGGTAPGHFVLRTPRARAVLWNPSPLLSWSRAAGKLMDYVVTIDGKPVARTAKTSYTPGRPLRDGRHVWMVVAVNRAGLTRASPASSFVVRSVRVVRRSLGFALAHGLYVKVFCAKACQIKARIVTGRRGPTARLSVGTRAAGISTLALPLSSAVSRQLRAPRHPRLTIVVLTRWARAARSVSVSRTW